MTTDSPRSPYTGTLRGEARHAMRMNPSGARTIAKRFLAKQQ